jgi:hypothetical protein
VVILKAAVGKSYAMHSCMKDEPRNSNANWLPVLAVAEICQSRQNGCSFVVLDVHDKSKDLGL